jgi:predicted enzyme related to lactoylglutathione lyase
MCYNRDNGQPVNLEEKMANHRIVHIEISSRDHAELKKFYGEVFNWKFMDIPEMDYVTFQPGENELGGGFNPISDDYPAGTVTIYIHTANLDESTAQIEAAGGTLTAPPMEVPGVGRIAMFKDPSGNELAILEPAQEM